MKYLQPNKVNDKNNQPNIVLEAMKVNEKLSRQNL